MTRVFTSNCISRIFWFGHAVGGIQKMRQQIFWKKQAAALQLHSPAGWGGEDYNTEKNVVAQGVTDDKGYLKIKDLKTTSYYVIARKGDKDNSGGGEQTGKLEANKLNKVTIIIQ